jgi:hypothetical protein
MIQCIISSLSLYIMVLPFSLSAKTSLEFNVLGNLSINSGQKFLRLCDILTKCISLNCKSD